MAETPAPEDRVPITVEVTSDQKRRLDQLADRKGVSPAIIIRNLIGKELDLEGEDASPDPPDGSFLDGIEHLIGSVEGPSDLSTNPEHMEGYGRS